LSAPSAPQQAPPRAWPRWPGASVWHGAWLLAIAAVVYGLWFWRLEWRPVAVMAVPALAGAVVGASPSFAVRAVVPFLWAFGAALATYLSGGVSGPLAAWVLSPLAAASVFGDRRSLALGGALSAVTAGVAAVLQLGGVVWPTPDAFTSLLLTAFALTTIGVGLAAGLIFSGANAARARRDETRDLRRWAAESRRVDSLIEAQPLMLLTIDSAGAVKDIAGPHLPDLDATRLRSAGLFAVATDADHAALDAAIATAVLEGQAEAVFSPQDAPQRIFTAQIRRTRTGALVAAVSDITRQHAREAALEQGKADAESLNAGKSRFLANMSHELRTPLNAIIGFSDVMRTGMFGPLTPKYAEYAGMIHESGGHLLDLINDVLDMSKIEAEKFELTREEFDAREAVSSALRLMRLQADEAGVQLRGILPSEEVVVDADRRALKQIVINLVSNALKFTGKAGQVTVTARAKDGSLEISVADTGMGISSEDLERLGRPYEQAGGIEQRSKGTGLGLSLVRAFSELHGGAMAIESSLGEGTAVTVRLPVLLTPKAETPPETPPQPPSPQEPRQGNVIAFDPRR
jgi:cell cycle sensor histidine kinase DivJ